MPGDGSNGGFCQPGYTYRDGGRWAFRCDVITTHPEDGSQVALGWCLLGGEVWEARGYTRDDWEYVAACGFSDIEAADGLPPLVTAEELDEMRARLAELEVGPGYLHECIAAAIDQGKAAMGVSVPRLPDPYGCTHCGESEGHHGRQYHPEVGWHSWVTPSSAQILARMKARRTNRASREGQ
ncbi:hypothetical protein ACIA6C_28110 [Streptomyces sp. NPDC051578]|uniref:hypothetical protein n=1 Tax=Streptomyces sp. NPDC051578 TaxID=3365662 RepID=UPI0037AB9CFC